MKKRGCPGCGYHDGNLERDRINEIGEEFKTLRTKNLLDFGIDILQADAETDRDSYRVRVRDLHFHAIGTGIYLYDAIYMALANLKEAHKESDKIENQISVVKVPSIKKVTPIITTKVDPKKLTVPKRI